MNNAQKNILTAHEIRSEIATTSSVYLTTNEAEFEQFVNRKRFPCMEFALDRLYAAEMVNGYIAEPCSCQFCN